MNAPHAKHAAAAAASADDAAMLRTDIRTVLGQLLTQVRLLRALNGSRQSVGLGFMTAELRERVDAQARADHRDRRTQPVRDLGLAWLNRDTITAGTGQVAAAATIASVSADAEITLALHDQIHRATRNLYKAGVCALTRLAPNPDTGDLITHLDHLVDLVTNRGHLTGILRDIEHLETQADEVVNGPSRSYHDEVCPWCWNRSLVIHHRLGLIRCDKDMRTGRFRPCACDDPWCTCHNTDPGTRQPGRHEWHRSPLTAPSLKHTWSSLNNLLTIAREIRHMETKALDAVDRVRQLHQPTYVVNDIEYTTYVDVPGSELERLAPDHVCIEVGYDTCDIDRDNPNDSVHRVPACSECQIATQDGTPGYLIYPCRTARALELDQPDTTTSKEPS